MIILILDEIDLESKIIKRDTKYYNDKSVSISGEYDNYKHMC